MGQIKTYFELEAGTICYKYENHELRFLLIHREKMNDYTLPKGHVEVGESLEETAIRETKEEAGYDPDLEAFIDSFEYKVKEKVDGTESYIIRRVYYFLAQIKGEHSLVNNPDVHEGKINIFWFSAGEMLDNLTYEADRKLIEQVQELLVSRK